MKRNNNLFHIAIIVLCLSGYSRGIQAAAESVGLDGGMRKGCHEGKILNETRHYSTIVQESMEKEEDVPEVLTAEQFFDYEICVDGKGEKYAVINGVREEYKNQAGENLRRLCEDWENPFPEQLEGIPVTGFGDYAFRDIPLKEHWSLQISSNIVSIGAHCFDNCGLSSVSFIKGDSEEDVSAGILTVGDGAFANNPELWGIYFNDKKVVFGENVFEGCAKKLYLCYRKGTEEQAAGLKKYALENGIYITEIPARYCEVPLVEYPETVLVLEPKVRNFFYGDNALEEDPSLIFQYDDKAPDFGFPEWQIPCGEFCAMMEWKYDITASSELYSEEEKYAAKNLEGRYGREYTWAEGAGGNGIGESISVVSRCGYNYEKEWYPEGKVLFLDGDIEPDIYDGYMRYTEICIVNGYAKNQKVWEENGRVKRLLMYVEDVPYAYLELEDTIYPQYFALPADGVKAADGVDIHFRFVIEDVYPGTKYEDTCLTGLVVDFMGRRQH